MFQAAAAAVNELLMTEVLDSGKVLSYLSGYFDRLTKAGSVPSSTSVSFLRYLFAVDFVDTMYAFLTEADYVEIESLLAGLFSAGDCLLPYPVLCSRRVFVGDAEPPRDGRLRITEDCTRFRETEDEKMRGV